MSRSLESRALLLDTHIWLWLVEGDATLSLTIREVIRAAADRGGLLVSAMSIWEVAMLASRNRTVLEKPTTAWVDEALARSGAVVEPLIPAIAIDSGRLPDGFRSDPADEIIVATARVTGAVLITRDRRILDYAARGNLAARAA